MRRKNHFHIIAFSAILSAMLTGSILVHQVAATIPGSVSFRPSSFDLRCVPPSSVRAEITLCWYYFTKQIDGSTVLLEGTLKPYGTKLYGSGTQYVFWAYFDGETFQNLLLGKAVQMELPEGQWSDISLTITGKLTWGAHWSVTGTVQVYVPEPPPPPPP